MFFSTSDYISQNEKILWSGKNIYYYSKPYDVVITSKKIIRCNSEDITMMPIRSITLVRCNSEAEVDVCATGDGTYGSQKMTFSFKGNDEVCKRFLQVLLSQVY